MIPRVGRARVVGDPELRRVSTTTMQTLQGIAVSPGVAIGEAPVIGNEGFRIPRRFLSRDAVQNELSRLKAAARVSVPANLCGQMSGAPAHVTLLLGLGLRELSVPSMTVPQIKKTCGSATIAECQAISDHAMTMDDAADIDNFLRAELRKVVPELSLC